MTQPLFASGMLAGVVMAKRLMDFHIEVLLISAKSRPTNASVLLRCIFQLSSTPNSIQPALVLCLHLHIGEVDGDKISNTQL